MSSTLTSLNDFKRETCPICSGAVNVAGSKMGKWRKRLFLLASCARCCFSFIQDPDLDFENIYNAEYYKGEGADPLVRYESDFSDPRKATRWYEFRGLMSRAMALTAVAPGETWLDFGCGAGGFVSYLRENGIAAYGFEEGFAASKASTNGVPMLSRAELITRRGTMRVVTAVEVLEHVVDPIETLQLIADCLMPGGVFLYTTGNARPFEDNLAAWSYVIPEIHISFFQPVTMKALFARVGLEPINAPFANGLTDIIRYKILKNLGIHSRNNVEVLLPWTMITKAADIRYEISAMMPARKLS